MNVLVRFTRNGLACAVFAALVGASAGCHGDAGQQPEEPRPEVTKGRVVVGRFRVDVPDVHAKPEEMFAVTPLEIDSEDRAPTVESTLSTKGILAPGKASIYAPGVYDPVTHTISATAYISNNDSVNNWDEPLFLITALSAPAAVAFIEAPGQTGTFAGSGGVGSNYAWADIERSGSVRPWARQKILVDDPGDAPFSFTVEITAIETTDSVDPDQDDDFWNTEPERAGHDCDDHDPTKFPGGGSCDTVDASLESGDADDATTDGAAPTVDGDAGSDIADSIDESATDAEIDAAVSLVCGDGLRDPLTEECDDGLGTSTTVRRTCSSDCHALDVLVGPSPAGDAGLAKSRTLQNGRHPIAASNAAAAVVFTELDSTLPRVALTTFDSKGAASDLIVSIGTGTTPALAANPVLAALPANRWATAWNDFGGDGDALGIALRAIDPASTSAAAVYANTTTEYSQHDPDLVWTGSELVVAWVDDSNVAHGSDIKLRRFSSALAPLSGEEELAVTLDDEADVALAKFGSGWAAAWRAARGGNETIHVQAGAASWSIGPFAPGPYGTKPALATLDASHLLVAFVRGVSGTDPPEFELQYAVLDTVATGAPTPSSIATTRPSQVNAVAAGGKAYVAWRENAASGDVKGEELWLQELGWSSSGLDATLPAIRMPRQVEHLDGDQRLPALAAFGPSSLMMAWDDLGPLAAPGSNVVVEIAGAPLLRSSTPTKCSNDGMCGGTPPPHCDSTAAICAGCAAKTDCRESGLACETTGSTCVECAADADCPSTRPKCHAATHTCKSPCSATICAGPTVCDSASGLCVQCTSDAQCAGGKCDTTLKKCVECMTDADCDAASPVCDSSHVCVEKCKTSSDCSPGFKCGLANLCYECLVNSDCGPKAICNPNHRCIGG